MRRTALDRAIEQLEQERAVLDAAIAKLKQQQRASTPRTPRVVKKAEA